MAEDGHDRDQDQDQDATGEDGSAEESRQNQYGGDSGEVDAVEQTEQMQDEEQTERMQDEEQTERMQDDEEEEDDAS